MRQHGTVDREVLEFLGICKPKQKKKIPAKNKRRSAKKLAVSNRKAFYRSYEWKKLRYAVLKDSSGRCGLCGVSSEDGARLNVDHIKPLHKYPELALSRGNLQVLCGTCNQGKGRWDETDWRIPDKEEEELWCENLGRDYLRLVSEE